MAYKRLNLKDGNIFGATHLTHIEDALENIDLIGSYTERQEYQIGNTNIMPKSCLWGVTNFISPDGSVSTYLNSNYICTKTYIPVDSGATYCLFYEGAHKPILHYAYYDSNYQMLSHSTAQTNMFTVISGASYIRFSVLVSMLGITAGEQTVDDSGYLTNPSGMFEIYKQTSTTYDPGVYVNKEVFNREDFVIPGDYIEDKTITLGKCNFTTAYPSINVCDPAILKSGYNSPANGLNKYGDNSVYVCTPAFSVSPGEKLSFWKLSDVEGTSASSIPARFVTAYDVSQQAVSDKSVTYANTYEVPDGVYYVMVTIHLDSVGQNSNLAYIQRSDSYTYRGYHAPFEPIYKLKSDVIDADLSKLTLHICLPPEICVPSGYQIDLYNNQCCLEADKYHVQWIGRYGSAYNWKYSITGDDALVGTSFTLTMNIVDDNLSILDTASTTVKFVSNVIGIKQLIIPIGDSLTNNKVWTSDIYSTLSNQMVEFRGTRGTTNPALVNGVTHEGRSGAGTGWYNSGTSTYTFDNNGLSTLPDVTTNPFWNTATDAFDFDYYCNSAADGGAGYFKNASGNNISLTPTGVMIFLGANGATLDPTTAVTNITTLVNLIRNSTKGASIPIYVVNTHYRAPYILSTTSDGFATNSSGEFKFQNDIKYQNLMRALNKSLENKTNVFIMPVNVTHDSTNNFPYTEENINPYNSSLKFRKYTDTIHPAVCGYNQMAVTMYGSICAHYNGQ